MFKVKIAFPVLYGLLVLNTFAQAVSGFFEPLPFSATSGTGGAATGADFSPVYLGRNPALLNRLDGPGVQVDHRGNENFFSQVYMGMFFPWQQFSFAAGAGFINRSGKRFTRPGHYALNGGHLSLGYDGLFLPVGATLMAYDDDTRRRNYVLDAGVVLPLVSESRRVINIHRLHLGLKARFALVNNSEFQIRPMPGLDFDFLKYRWLRAGAFLDFPIEADFERVPTEYGLSLGFFDFALLNLGFSGEEFFSSENLHASFTARYRFANTGFRVDLGHMKSDQVELANSQPAPNIGLLLYYRGAGPAVFTSSDYLRKYNLVVEKGQQPVPVSIDISGIKLGEAIDSNYLVEDGTGRAVMVYHNTVASTGSLLKPAASFSWNGTDHAGVLQQPGLYRAYVFVLRNDRRVEKYHVADINLVEKNTIGLVEVSPARFDLGSGQGAIDIRVKVPPRYNKAVSLSVADLAGKSVYDDYCQPMAGTCLFQWYPDQAARPGQFSARAVLQTSRGPREIMGGPVLVMQPGDRTLPRVKPVRLSGQDASNSGIEVSWHRLSQVEQYNLAIMNSAGEEVLSLATGQNRQKFTLPGATHGQYTCLVKDSRGRVLGSSQFFIDNRGPRLAVKALPVEGFVPGFDLNRSMVFETSYSDESRIEQFKVVVKDQWGDAVWQFDSRQPVSRVHFNGMQGNQPLLRSHESYQVIIEAIDQFNNRGRARANFTTGLVLRAESEKLVKQGPLKFYLDKNYRAQLQSIQFKGGTDIPLAGSEGILRRQVVPLLKRLAGFHIRIEGHIHAIREKNQYQQQLSERRAERVRRLLVQMGIQGRRLSTRGWGGEKPVATGGGSKTAALNRRVEFVLFKANSSP